jgi:hypothetical protein
MIDRQRELARRQADAPTSANGPDWCWVTRERQRLLSDIARLESERQQLLGLASADAVSRTRCCTDMIRSRWRRFDALQG